MRSAIALLSALVLAAAACGGPPPGAAPTAAAMPEPAGASAPAVTATPEPASPVAPPTASSAAPAAPEPEPPPIKAGTSVLHIGDSFVLAGFAQALKARMKPLGVRYEVRSEQSSYTVTWASKMDQLVANTQPHLVIVTLGANEVANTDPPAHAPAIRRIVKAIGNRPCVWVLPPRWRKDTGIFDVIRDNSAPCRFFDTDVHVKEPIARRGDKIHPTPEGGETWAAGFWAWLMAERAPAGSSDNPWTLKPPAPDERTPRPAAAALAP